jgi:hypothetical protein
LGCNLIANFIKKQLKKIKTMQNKKIKLIAAFFVVLLVAFSPYTITKLATYGSDLLSENETYQNFETKLSELSTEENVISETVNKENEASLKKLDSVEGIESSPIANSDYTKTETPFYQFVDGQSNELTSDLSEQKIEEGAFSGTYNNPNNFQEIRINLNEANQSNLSSINLRENYLVYDLFLENAVLVEDFNTELGNQMDERELEWKYFIHPSFQDGWNEVRLALPDGVATGSVDWEKLGYFRLYFKFFESSGVELKNIRIETRKAVLPAKKDIVIVVPSEDVQKEVVVLGSEAESNVAGNTAFDPAIAPGVVSARILLSETEKVPNFSVRVKFVGVGERIIETKTNKEGRMETSLTSGRYYAEILPDDNSYRLEGDAPAFFLPANSAKDLGDLYLIKK